MVGARRGRVGQTSSEGFQSVLKAFSKWSDGLAIGQGLSRSEDFVDGASANPEMGGNFADRVIPCP